MDLKQPIQLKINISNKIIKTCLTQKYNDKKYSYVYYLRKMFEIKTRYNIYDKKFFIIVEIIKH